MKRLSLILFILHLALAGFSQKATITEFSKEFVTYPFSDPNPNPILMKRNFKIYPYHSFDGYTLVPEEKKWKVIKLENDYIEVYIFPEIGGKVWGAIEKSTGKEFIYTNDVVKFRNIAMRGPWTSGGIEFNLGLIGHTPATATPVDYITKENPDGSVSCIVGNMDLPSRTQWRVEIRLPKDKAYFETIPLWYNPTMLSQSYYCFMTGAAAVSDDLEFFYPGNQALEHNGQVKPYPFQDGHNKSIYSNNAYGSHTSIHVVGDYNDFFGGYFHQSEFGFGHWALYNDMPGRKNWLWALSREGEIWKDLLTDKHPQYMEFQAGRSFNQYSQSAFRSPIKELPFNPGVTDQWREIWFPVKEIGGMQEVSPSGILNVKRENGKIQLGINALEFVKAKLIVKSNENIVYTEEKSFKPMEVYKKEVELRDNEPFEVIVEGMDLKINSEKKNLIKRPFATTMKADTSSASYWFQNGIELKENRNYIPARQNFQKCLAKDPIYIDAMVALSELYYRNALYDTALIYANQVLQLDAYHPAANYYAGISYLAQNNLIDALETFGWAARSLEYRTASYAQMAGIELHLNNLLLAEQYANQSLDYNRFNFNALKILSIIHRISGEKEQSEKILSDILTLDPLNHFADFEHYLLNTNAENLAAFKSKIRNEFPYQTYLELAIEYYHFGIKEDAIKVLELSLGHALIALWKAYLNNNTALLNEAIKLSPAFVFPYRTETVDALKWAVANNNHWKFKYYLALNYWAIDRVDEARALLLECNAEPDFATFYTSRAFLLNEKDKKQAMSDLQKAKQLDPNDWRNWNELIESYESISDYKTALSVSTEAVNKFSGNYNLSLQYARVQLNNQLYAGCIKTLEKTTIIPFEGSTQGKVIYEQATLNLAIDLMIKKKYNEAIVKLNKSKSWPENLGVGEPYDPDNRLQNYLEAICFDRLGKSKNAVNLRDSILNFTVSHYVDNQYSYNNLPALWIMQKNGKSNEANDLLRKIKEINNSNPIHRWVIASFLNDTETLTELDKVLLTNNYIKIIKKIKELEK